MWLHRSQQEGEHWSTHALSRATLIPASTSLKGTTRTPRYIQPTVTHAWQLFGAPPHALPLGDTETFARNVSERKSLCSECLLCSRTRLRCFSLLLVVTLHHSPTWLLWIKHSLNFFFLVSMLRLGLQGYLAVADLQYTALMVCSHPACFFALHPWQRKSHHLLFGFQSSDSWSDVHIIQKTLLKEHHSWHWAYRHLPWDAAIKKREKKSFSWDFKFWVPLSAFAQQTYLNIVTNHNKT